MNQIEKICTKCKESKIENLNNFYFRKDTNKFFNYCIPCINNKEHKYRTENKEKELIRKRIYNSNNKDKISKQKSEYYQLNKDRISAVQSKYEKANHKKRKEYRKVWQKNRRDTDPAYRLRYNVGRAVRTALTKAGYSKSNASFFDYVDYTADELKFYIESLFESWMNWDNYGNYKNDKIKRWNIDHIIPQSKLPYNSMEHENFKKCWALHNLRPIESIENIKKGNQ